MSSNEYPDQEMEQVLQTHFESEAEGLKAPTGLWSRIEARLRVHMARGVAPPIWQRLVSPGRWGLSPALGAMALLVLAVSGTWLFTATPWRGDGRVVFALQPAAAPTPTPAPRQPGATRAPAPTAAPTAASAPTGAGGAAGAAGPPGAPGEIGDAGATAKARSPGQYSIPGGGSTNTDQWIIIEEPVTRRLPRFPAITTPSQPPLPSAGAGQRGQLETVQRQVISQGSLSVNVEDVPFATVQVRLIAEGVGGFVEQISSQGVEERQQSTMTIRVPQPEFFNVFDRIKLLGKVSNENAGSEDVTERFIDLDARLKSASREESSLLSLLERAGKVSEILTIERELSRIRTELEQVQGQLNFLERRVNLATIVVALFPPQFREGQPPSASLSIVVSDVSQRVEETKALVSAANGAFDQVFTTVQDGTERASLTVRVFAADFSSVVSAIESQGEVKGKEVREGIGPMDSGTATPEDPDSRITISFIEEESSNTRRWVAIGAAGSAVILAFLLYAAYQIGQRRGERE